MAESAPILSIRERIERQLVANLTALLPTWAAEELAAGLVTAEDVAACTVQRWDARGNDLKSMDVLLVGHGETIEDAGMGGSGGSVVDNMADYSLLVALRLPEADPADEDDPAHVSSSEVCNRWLARLRAAAVADPRLIEDVTEITLAADVRCTASRRIDTETGQREFVAAIDFTVEYQSNFDSPYYGPGIDPPEEE